MTAMHSRQPAVSYPLMAWQGELPGSASKALAAGQSGQDHPVCNVLSVTAFVLNRFVAHVGRSGELEVPTA